MIKAATVDIRNLTIGAEEHLITLDREMSEAIQMKEDLMMAAKAVLILVKENQSKESLVMEKEGSIMAIKVLEDLDNNKIKM